MHNGEIILSQVSETHYQPVGSEDSENSGESESIAELREEYRNIADMLSKQGCRQDPVLLMRLRIILVDIGIYKESPP